MPPVEAGNYLVDYLFEVGPVMSGGMGAMVVTHEELQAWQRNTGIDLQPWEARGLRRLSAEYLGESRRGEDPHCPPPWAAPGAIVLSAEASRARDAIRGLAQL